MSSIATGCPEGASLQDGCTTCIDGYYGDPVNGKPCQKCICNNNIDLNVTGNCDTRNGNCLKCINNTTGNQCQVCADRFYGDAVNGTCLRKLVHISLNKSINNCEHMMIV